MSSPLEGLPSELSIEAAREEIASRQREKDEVGQQDFLRMLVTQLENQDPLNPQDSAQFTAQLATFSSLEQQIAMRSSLDKLVESQGALNGDAENLQLAGLIGREVTAVGDQIEISSDSPAPVPLLFGLEQPAERVEIEVQKGGVAVARLSLDRHGAGANRVDWDRKGFDGRPVPPGSYRFKVEAYSGPDADQPDVAAEAVMAGRVTGTLFDESGPLLRLGGRLVPFRDVFEVHEPGAAP